MTPDFATQEVARLTREVTKLEDKVMLQRTLIAEKDEKLKTAWAIVKDTDAERTELAETKRRLALADALAAALVDLDDGTNLLVGTTSRPALYAYLGVPEPKP